MKYLNLLFFLFPIITQAQVFVDQDASGSNDGSSWTNAYIQLEDAFINASTGDNIWVAEGIYKRQTTDRNSYFGWGRDSVRVYGGFNGTETLLSQRDWITNRTIMSGDIGTVGDNSDNCYTVFSGPIGTSSSILSYGLLDGFVIQDGNANTSGGGYDSKGAGYHGRAYCTKMEFHNCEFSNNSAQYGTGFYSIAETNAIELIVDACIFKNNIGRWGVGSQIHSENGATMNATFTNCLYANNEAKDMGSLGLGSTSVIYVLAFDLNSSIDVSVINTTFANNQNNGTHANNYFGTIMCYNEATSGTQNLTVDNCIFWGNTGDTTSIITHPVGNDFTSIEVENTLSEYLPFPVIATTTNIINLNPIFTSSTDFTLQDNSPAVNTGSLSGLSIPMLDLAGNTRLVNDTIDLGCYENQTVIVDTISNAINDLSFKTLKVFPNPTTGFVSISVNEKITSISLKDITGNHIKSFDSNAKQLDVSDISTGIYFLEVANLSKKSIIKLSIKN